MSSRLFLSLVALFISMQTIQASCCQLLFKDSQATTSGLPPFHQPWFYLTSSDNLPPPHANLLLRRSYPVLSRANRRVSSLERDSINKLEVHGKLSCDKGLFITMLTKQRRMDNIYVNLIHKNLPIVVNNRITILR